MKNYVIEETIQLDNIRLTIYRNTDELTEEELQLLKKYNESYKEKFKRFINSIFEFCCKKCC